MTKTYEVPSGYSTEIRCFPGYDYRDDPADQRGAHGMSLYFIVRDEKVGAAITASISTGWMRHPLAGGYDRGAGVQRRRDRVGVDGRLNDHYPSGAGVSLHAPTQVKDYMFGPQSCDLTATGECYGDTGYLISDEVLGLLVEGGDGAVWPFLIETMQSWLAPEPVDA